MLIQFTMTLSHFWIQRGLKNGCFTWVCLLNEIKHDILMFLFDNNISASIELDIIVFDDNKSKCQSEGKVV